MEQATDTRAALARILAAHKAYFDVTQDYAFEGHTFAGYAEFHSSASKYVLSKKAKLWEATAHEYIFFEEAANFDEGELAQLVSFMTEKALTKVKPERDHMTSYISLVVVAQSVSAGVACAVRRVKFRKNFNFGLNGWADLRVCVCDLSASEIYTNAMGKEMLEILRANALGVSAAPKKSAARRLFSKN